MKKHRSLLILTGVLAILILAYLGLGSYNKKQEQKKGSAAQEKSVTVTDIPDIQEIAYQYEGNDFAFAKKKEMWVYTKDKEFPVAQSYIDAMASAFGKITAVRELEEIDKLSDYGLEHPKYTVHLKDAEGTETTLYFGNAVEENYYMTLNDKAKVYTVSGTILDTISYELNDFLQKETLPVIGSSNLKKVIVTEKGVQTVYDSSEESQKETLTAIAGGFGAASFGTCVEYAVKEEKLASYGLDEANKTKLEAIYEDADQKEQTLILNIGKTDESGAYYYVQLDGSKMVYQMGKEVVENMLNKGE